MKKHFLMCYFSARDYASNCLCSDHAHCYDVFGEVNTGPFWCWKETYLNNDIAENYITYKNLYPEIVGVRV